MAADCGTPLMHSQPRDLPLRSVQPQLPDVDNFMSNSISGVDTEMVDYNRRLRVRFYPRLTNSSVTLCLPSENSSADNPVIMQRAEFADREQASLPVSSGLFGWDLFEGQRKGFADMGMAPQAGETPFLTPVLIYIY